MPGHTIYTIPFYIKLSLDEKRALAKGGIQNAAYTYFVLYGLSDSRGTMIMLRSKDRIYSILDKDGNWIYDNSISDNDWLFIDKNEFTSSLLKMKENN